MTMFRTAAIIAALLSALAVTMAMGSKEAPEEAARPAQAIRGTVEIWEGNFMPMTDPKSDRNTIRPGAGRKVRVHEPVRMGSAASAKLEAVPTPLIAETACDENGAFSIAVEPGAYSVFVEEDGGWYYNGWDGSGVQGAVEVIAGEDSEVLIKITTSATF